MKKALVSLVLISVVLMAGIVVGCSIATSPSSGGTISVSVSAGTLTGSGLGWSFDAGTVLQNTTYTVNFIVTNSTSTSFIATGSQTFTNNDFSDSLPEHS